MTNILRCSKTNCKMKVTKKTIWIINYYSAPPEYSTHERHIKLAQHLEAHGYNAVIVSAGFLPKEKTNLIDGNVISSWKTYDGIKFLHFRTLRYSKSGLVRMISIFLFSLMLGPKMFVHKPTAVLHNVHPPFDFMVTFYAKLFRIKYVAEAWDLWPENFIKFGLISERNILIPIARLVERYMYSKAESIVFTFAGGKKYLVDRGYTTKKFFSISTNNVYYVNNGIDLNAFRSNLNNEMTVDLDLDSNEHKKIIYVGALNMLNNIKELIQAGELLRNRDDILILIYGDGDYRAELIEYCTKNNLTNVRFKDKRVKFNKIPYILSKGHVNVLTYTKGFGDFGSSSGKLFLYLASGKPVCSNIRFNHCLISENGLGIAKDMSNVQEFANSLEYLVDLNDNKRNAIAQRSFKVMEKYDTEVLSRQIVKILTNE